MTNHKTSFQLFSCRIPGPLLLLALTLALFHPSLQTKDIKREMEVSILIADGTDPLLKEIQSSDGAIVLPEEVRLNLIQEHQILLAAGIPARQNFGPEQINRMPSIKTIPAEQHSQILKTISSYILKQPEMSEVTNFSLQEQKCMILRRFSSSLPFNNPDFQNANVFQNMMTKYDQASYRELTLKLLLNQTLLSNEEFVNYQQNLTTLINSKRVVEGLLPQLNLPDPFIYSGQTHIVRETAIQKLQLFQEQRQQILQKFHGAKVIMMNYLVEVQNLSAALGSINIQNLNSPREDLPIEDAILLFNCLEDLSTLFESCKSGNNILEHPILKLVAYLPPNFPESLTNYAYLLNRKADFQAIQDYIDVSYIRKKNCDGKEKIVEEENKLNKKIKRSYTSLTAEIKEMKTMLKTQINGKFEYRDYTDAINDYNGQLKIMTAHYDKLVKFNRMIDRLKFLIETNPVLQNADMVVPHKVLFHIENEINTISNIVKIITDLRKDLNQQVEMYSATEDQADADLASQQITTLEFLITYYNGSRNVSEERLEMLKTVFRHIKIIQKLEENFDRLLAATFSEAIKIMNSSGEKQTKMLCFDEVDLGHLLINMVKHNMILNLESFMLQLVKDWDYVSVKKFVLRNYYIMTSPQYQGQSLVLFSETKFMGESEENQKKNKIIRDYTTRVLFFTDLYATNVHEIDFENHNNSFQKYGLIFSSIVKQVWDFISRITKNFSITVIVEWIFDLLKEVIPFLGSIKFFYRFLKSLLFLLVDEIWEFLRDKFSDWMDELKPVWLKMLSDLSELLGNKKIYSTNTEKFFLESDAWMSWESKCWQFDFCYEQPVMQSLYQKMPNNQVFDLSSLEEIENEYVRHLQIQKSDVTNFEALNYIRKMTEFNGSDYLVNYRRLAMDPDLLLTTCIYYKARLNINPQD